MAYFPRIDRSKPFGNADNNQVALRSPCRRDARQRIDDVCQDLRQHRIWALERSSRLAVESNLHSRHCRGAAFVIYPEAP